MPADCRGGLGIYDVSDPRSRRRSRSGRPGHRRAPLHFDGRYAYMSPELDGYVGNIVMILDLADPRQAARGRALVDAGAMDRGRREADLDRGPAHRCHHPIRMGNRLYVSYWHGGFVILDIADMSKPKFVSALDWSPPFPWPDPLRGAGARSTIRGRAC